MPIKVQYGTCGASLKAPDKAAGKSLPCPGCQQPIAVPDVDPLAALDQMQPQSEFGSVFDGMGTDDAQQPMLGVPADPMGGMGAGPAQGVPYGQTQGAMPFGGHRAPMAQTKKRDDPTSGASNYTAVGGGVGLVLAMLFMGLNFVVGGDDEKIADVEAARERAHDQIAALKREAVNIPKPRNKSPLEEFGGNNDNSQAQRPQPGRSNNSNSSGGNRGNTRPRPGDGRPPGNRGDRTPPKPINTNMAINGAEPPPVEHSGESTESRFAVNFNVNDGAILMPLRPWTTSAGEKDFSSTESVAACRREDPIGDRSWARHFGCKQGS